MSQLQFNRFKENQPLKRMRPNRNAENNNRSNNPVLTEEEAFKRNRQDFFNFRANWRKSYARVVTAIKDAKHTMKDKNVGETVRRKASSDLQEIRAIARSMMMARESANEKYQNSISRKEADKAMEGKNHLL